MAARSPVAASRAARAESPRHAGGERGQAGRLAHRGQRPVRGERRARPGVHRRPWLEIAQHLDEPLGACVEQCGDAVVRRVRPLVLPPQQCGFDAADVHRASEARHPDAQGQIELCPGHGRAAACLQFAPLGLEPRGVVVLRVEAEAGGVGKGRHGASRRRQRGRAVEPDQPIRLTFVNSPQVLRHVVDDRPLQRRMTGAAEQLGDGRGGLGVEGRRGGLERDDRRQQKQREQGAERHHGSCFL
jgi:hypothetical protein